MSVPNIIIDAIVNFTPEEEGAPSSVDVVEISNAVKFRDVKLGYYTVPIYKCNFPAENCYGYFINEEEGPRIYISKKISGAFLVETILHELYHAGAYIYGHSNEDLNEERWVDFCATLTTQLMVDDPDFIKWCTTNTKA